MGMDSVLLAWRAPTAPRNPFIVTVIVVFIFVFCGGKRNVGGDNSIYYKFYENWFGQTVCKIRYDDDDGGMVMTMGLRFILMAKNLFLKRCSAWTHNFLQSLNAPCSIRKDGPRMTEYDGSSFFGIPCLTKKYPDIEMQKKITFFFINLHICFSFLFFL